MDIFLVIMHCLIASVVSNALYLDQYYVTELFLICFFSTGGSGFCLDAFRSPSGERDDGRENLLEVELNKRTIWTMAKFSSYLGTLPNLTLTI